MEFEQLADTISRNEEIGSHRAEQSRGEDCIQSLEVDSLDQFELSKGEILESSSNNVSLCSLGGELSPASVNQSVTPISQSSELSSTLDSSGVSLDAKTIYSPDGSILSTTSQYEMSTTLSSLDSVQDDSMECMGDTGAPVVCCENTTTSTPKATKGKKGKLRQGRKERELMRKRKMDGLGDVEKTEKAAKMQKKQLSENDEKLPDENIETGEKEKTTECIDDSPVQNEKTSGKRLSRKERKKLKKSNLGSELESDGDGNKEVKEKPKKITPNHFLAIRVSNPCIHDTAKVIQDSITNHNKHLEPAIIPINTLHITLMVMHLEREQTEEAITVLENCRKDLAPIMLENTPTMMFEGLGHFKNEVLFAKIQDEEEVKTLNVIAEILKTKFAEGDIFSTDDRPFKPHLTLAKLSRMRTKRVKKAPKKIPAESYNTWMEAEFGVESVSKIYLCSMIDAKQKDGFYHCVGCLDFSEDDGDDPGRPGSDEHSKDQGNNIGAVVQQVMESPVSGEQTAVDKMPSEVPDGVTGCPKDLLDHLQESHMLNEHSKDQENDIGAVVQEVMESPVLGEQTVVDKMPSEVPDGETECTHLLGHLQESHMLNEHSNDHGNHMEAAVEQVMESPVSGGQTLVDKMASEVQCAEVTESPEELHDDSQESHDMLNEHFKDHGNDIEAVIEQGIESLISDKQIAHEVSDGVTESPEELPDDSQGGHANELVPEVDNINDVVSIAEVYPNVGYEITEGENSAQEEFAVCELFKEIMVDECKCLIAEPSYSDGEKNHPKYATNCDNSCNSPRTLTEEKRDETCYPGKSSNNNDELNQHVDCSTSPANKANIQQELEYQNHQNQEESNVLLQEAEDSQCPCTNIIGHCIDSNGCKNALCNKKREPSSLDVLLNRAKEQSKVIRPLEVSAVSHTTESHEFPMSPSPEVILEDSNAELDDFVIVDCTDEGLLLMAEHLDGKSVENKSHSERERSKDKKVPWRKRSGFKCSIL